MPRKLPEPTVDGDGRAALPVQVPLEIPLPEVARAMAIQHGVPGRKIGRDHVRPAVIALVALRAAREPEPDVRPEVCEQWQQRLVAMEVFPPAALQGNASK